METEQEIRNPIIPLGSPTLVIRSTVTGGGGLWCPFFEEQQGESVNGVVIGSCEVKVRHQGFL
jgi:hypothetical protein